MGSQNPQVQSPRFGFSPKQLITTSLTDAALTGLSVPRAPGLQFVVAMGTITLTGGAGEVSLLVEGSNNGSDWITVGETSPSEYFTSNGQVQILNVSTGSLTDLEHWAFVRVRAVVISGAPIFSLDVIVSGIARDCESYLRGDAPEDQFVSRLGTVPTVSSTEKIRRPAGTVLANCQVSASGIVLGGLTSFVCAVQGSPDGGSTWVDIGLVEITADGTEVMTVGGESLFSLGAYYDFRFQVSDNGAATGTTSYGNITFFLSLDSCDWVIDGDPGSGGGGSSDLGDAFITVDFGAPGIQFLSTISISLQVFDAQGVPLASSRKIEIIAYDVPQGGDLDLSLNATIEAVSTGTAISGLSTNRTVLTTDASGVAVLDIQCFETQDVYITAVNPSGPNALILPQVIIAAAELDLFFDSGGV